MSSPPILDNKQPDAASVFEPVALLREARRQKGLAIVDVPQVCILDPDGDIVRRLKNLGEAKRFDAWPCYHTDLYAFPLAGQIAGIIGCVVGAPFAVLVAEELFACGCRILISLTSAGQISPAGSPPYFVVIDRALRDEGTSYHYAATGYTCRNAVPPNAGLLRVRAFQATRDSTGELSRNFPSRRQARASMPRLRPGGSIRKRSSRTTRNM